MRSTHRSRRAVTRWSKAVRRAAAISVPSSSRVTVEDEATMDRSSRRGTSLPAARAEAARSFQEARLTTGSSCSARASKRPGGDLGAAARPGPGCSAPRWRGGRRGCRPSGAARPPGAAPAAAWPGRRCGRCSTGSAGADCPDHPTPAPRAGPGRCACVRRTPTARRTRRRPRDRVSLRGPRSPPPSLPSDRGRRSAGRRAPSRGPSPRSSRRRLDLGASTTLTSGPALGRAEDLDPVHPAAVALALGGQEGGDGGAVQRRLDLGPEHGAHPGPFGHEGGLDRSPGLLGPGGAPRPGGVPGLTGEFDFDAMGHTGRQATADDALVPHLVPDRPLRRG